MEQDKFSKFEEIVDIYPKILNFESSLSDKSKIDKNKICVGYLMILKSYDDFKIAINYENYKKDSENFIKNKEKLKFEFPIKKLNSFKGNKPSYLINLILRNKSFILLDQSLYDLFSKKNIDEGLTYYVDGDKITLNINNSSITFISKDNILNRDNYLKVNENEEYIINRIFNSIKILKSFEKEILTGQNVKEGIGYFFEKNKFEEWEKMLDIYKKDFDENQTKKLIKDNITKIIELQNSFRVITDIENFKKFGHMVFVNLDFYNSIKGDEKVFGIKFTLNNKKLILHLNDKKINMRIPNKIIYSDIYKISHFLNFYFSKKKNSLDLKSDRKAFAFNYKLIEEYINLFEKELLDLIKEEEYCYDKLEILIQKNLPKKDFTIKNKLISEKEYKGKKVKYIENFKLVKFYNLFMLCEPVNYQINNNISFISYNKENEYYCQFGKFDQNQIFINEYLILYEKYSKDLEEILEELMKNLDYKEKILNNNKDSFEIKKNGTVYNFTKIRIIDNDIENENHNIMNAKNYLILNNGEQANINKNQNIKNNDMDNNGEKLKQQIINLIIYIISKMKILMIIFKIMSCKWANQIVLD